MVIRQKRVKGLQVALDTHFRPGADFMLIQGDVLESLRQVPAKSVNLVVTSPPYNLGKTYERKTSLDAYLQWQRQVVEGCVKTLKADGSICWEVGNYVEDGEVFPLDVYFYPLFKELGLRLRNRIVWHFEHGLHGLKRFSGRYETILWFTRDSYVFNLDAVRVPQKYPLKRAYKGPRKGELTCNPLGKNPSDVWAILESDWASGVWDIPNVKSNHPEKTAHPAQFPVELVERLVLALTNPGDLVLDPFAGAGSAMVAAALHGRKAIGIDREEAYADIAFQRTVETLKGTAKVRPLGRPIYRPKENRG